MSWGTNYKYEGVISRVGINELEQKLEETQTLLNGIREEMIALMAMSPPANGMVEDEDGGKILWPQYVVRRLNCLWEELEELMCCSVRLQQALEVKLHWRKSFPRSKELKNCIPTGRQTRFIRRPL